MEISLSRSKAGRTRGFSLIETMIAITILAVGLLGVAALLAKLTTTTVNSRYMSTENLLASEKLEDLNHLPFSDASIYAPPNGVAGSLIVDISTNVQPPTATAAVPVSYFDVVQLSASNGAVTEVSNGSVVTHTPDGQVNPNAPAPPPAAEMLQFKRRWVIEQDQPVAGVRRITVVVIPENVKTPPFQTSMVRP